MLYHALLGDVLPLKKVTLSWLMNSNMVKHGKFDHLHLVYHFTVSLIIDKYCSFDSFFRFHRLGRHSRKLH